MVFNYNSLGLIKQPKISIHRLDLGMIGYLDAFNIVIKPTFCNLSELTFKCYKNSQHYSCLRKDMVLEIEGFGRFIIYSVNNNQNGQVDYVEVTAHSYEETLNKTTLTYTENAYMKLWDAIDPAHGSLVRQPDGSYAQFPTLLYIVQQQTGWTIDHVDSDLLNEYRTMDIDDEQVYGFLMSTVADTFKCYFDFDTVNKKINCYSKDETTYQPVNTGINFSFRNLIKEQTVTESADDIITALTVKGAEGVGISLVNPLGNDVLYDFSYYMNDEEWGMPADLQLAVTEWLELIESKQTQYEQAVANYRQACADATEYKADLKVLKSELIALQDVQAVDIAANNEQGLQDIYPQIVAKENAIKNKQMDVDFAETKKEAYMHDIELVVQALSFENNFTTAQLEQLQYYINGSVYENENFVFTTDMPEEQKIDTEKSLYQYGLQMLKKLSSPLYQYTCTISPFFFDEEYKKFTNNIVLGGAVNLEKEPNEWVSPRLIQLVIDYDEPENSTAVLSDSYRLIGGAYEFSNGFNQAIKASRKTSLAAPLWDEPVNNGFYGTVTEYINNALNLANQEIINANNQEFKLGSYGLRGRMWVDDDDDYDPHQVAMTNNVLAFTDDNWQSCKMAIGKVTIGQSEYYGVVAEALVGELIAGSQMIIRDANSTFVIDSAGASLENAPFTVYNSSSRILINPTDGFKIQKKNGNVWDDVLSEDNSGNIIANSIKVQSGTVGGWQIQNDGLYSPSGDYIKTDGTGKLSLLTYTNGSAVFDGDVYANNLKWDYGSGTPASIFTVSSGIPGMAGSWLTAGSVGTDRRNAAQWDALYADKIYCDQMFAEMITVDNLLAGQIVSGSIVTELLFGGKFYVGSSQNPYNRATIYGKTDDISAQIRDQYSLYMETAGNIHLNTDNGSVLVNNALHAHDITVTADETVNGTLRTEWLQVNQKINRVVVSDYFATDERIDATIGGRLWITGGTAVKQGNSYWHGQTTDITIDGVTLHFKDGLLI